MSKFTTSPMLPGNMKRRGNLTKQQVQALNEKKEVLIENLDKAQVIFSKKHAMLTRKSLADFYSIKMRKPITDQNVYVQINIEVDTPHLVIVEPSSITLDMSNQSATIKVSSLSLEDPFTSDQQFTISHLTASSDLELHKQRLNINCYQLSQQFKEVLSAGRDDQFQLGHQMNVERFMDEKYNKDWDKLPSPYNALSSYAKVVDLMSSVRETGSTELIQVANGKQHSAILKKDGSLYTWGVGQSGQLGFDKQEIADCDLANAKIVHPLQDKVKYYGQIDFRKPQFTSQTDSQPAFHIIEEQKSSAKKSQQDLFDSTNEPNIIDLKNPEVWVPFLLKPTKVPNFAHRIKQIACGAYHTMVITIDNTVFGCGLNDCGQLGINNYQSPYNLNIEPTSPKKRMHSGRQQKKEIELVTNQKAYGNDVYPKLTQVSLSCPIGLSMITCGDYFTLALANDGNVYSTGSGSQGIHGLGHDSPECLQDRFEFAAVGSDRMVDGIFEKKNVKYINAGEAHCACIDGNGSVYIWGRNTYGECGVKPQITQIVSVPKPLKLTYQGQKRLALQVACGGYHTLILSQSNDVYAMGKNDSGQLGLSSNQYEHESEPCQVALFVEKVVTSIAAGSNHSVALTVEGYAYSWGSNARGQLALEDSISFKRGSNLAQPRILESMLGRGISCLTCKYEQTYLCNSEKGTYTDTETEVFALWRQKLRRHEEKNALMANYLYRNEKRLEKQRLKELAQMGQLNDDLNQYGQPTAEKMRSIRPTQSSLGNSGGQASNKFDSEERRPEGLQAKPLGPMPSWRDFSSSYSVNLVKKLHDKDCKKKQIYEFTDFDSENCQVTAFKKISVQNPASRLNCFVTSFPFSGHSKIDDDGKEIQPPIQNSLNNQNAILRQLVSSEKQSKSDASRSEENAVEEQSPFVFLMNKLKYEQMLVSPTGQDGDGQGETDNKGHLEIQPGFSMFNKLTEFPYDPIPNVFKISPPEDDEQD